MQVAQQEAKLPLQLGHQTQVLEVRYLYLAECPTLEQEVQLHGVQGHLPQAQEELYH